MEVWNGTILRADTEVRAVISNEGHGVNINGVGVAIILERAEAVRVLVELAEALYPQEVI